MSKRSFSINWRYTIGEILIVIISILIAFAVNRFTENVKDQETYELYRSSFIQDLTEDSLKLESLIAEVDSSIQYTYSLIGYVFNAPEEVGSGMLKFYETFNSDMWFYPTESTYLSINNSGDWKLFKDFTLKKDIVAHYGQYQQVYAYYENLQYFHQNAFYDFMLEEIDFGQLRIKQEHAFAKDPKFLKLLYTHMGILNQIKVAMSEGKASCNELVQQLERATYRKTK